MKLLKRKLRKNFTLLELLIIVAILAIVGGGLVTSFEGLQAQAAKASATNTIASLQNSIRTYHAMESKLPDNLDSLLAATPSSPTVVDGVQSVASADSFVGPEDFADTSDPTLAADGLALKNFLGCAKMGSKVEAQKLSGQQRQNLIDAGITTYRVLDTKGLVGAASALTIFNADGGEAKVNAIADVDIPQLAFNIPRDGNGKTRDRGRGFPLAIDDSSVNLSSTNQEFAVWGGQDADDIKAEYNNTKLGGDPLGVLVAFGIGPDSTIVAAGKSESTLANEADKSLGEAGSISSAPYYGDVAKSTYPSYVMLVDVQQSPAKFVAVVDARGDFLAEEFAEQSGQKK